MAEEACWYVVHTYSGYENKVATNLETLVENRRLHDLIQEVKIPTEIVPEIKDGVKREVERKLFPGYVLVKMVMTDDSWYVVRNTRGVTGIHDVPPDFIALYDRSRLACIERYLRALALRARRALVDPEKDRTKSQGPQIYAERLQRLLATLGPPSSPQKRQALEELVWMIEEYKVSIFAQELKTAGPMSPKRLDEKIAEIERMT